MTSNGLKKKRQFQIPGPGGRLGKAMGEEKFRQVALKGTLTVGFDALNQVFRRDIAFHQLEARETHVLVDAQIFGSNPAGLNEKVGGFSGVGGCS